VVSASSYSSYSWHKYKFLKMRTEGKPEIHMSW
jgi:hypothetical protein